MATAPETSEPKRKSRTGLFLVLAVVVLGGAGAGAFAFMKMRAPKPGAKLEAHVEDKAAPAPEAEGGVISLEPFVTNLAGPDSDRYVKCTIRLEIDRKETAEKVKTDDLSITRLRDRVLTLLTSKRLEDIATAEGKEHLRDEIRGRVEPLLSGGKVREVYYTEFLVQ